MSDFPILFLDTDGVLNSMDSCRAFEGYGSPRSPWRLDPVRVQLVRTIVERKGFHIVWSSSWRQGYGPEKLASIMALYGWYNCPVFDVTGQKQISGWGSESDDSRGAVISRWLHENAPDRGLDGYYVVVDDHRGAGVGHKSNFVRTDPDTGITTKDCRKAERIVNDVYRRSGN